MIESMRSALLLLVALCLGTFAWLPAVQLLFPVDRSEIADRLAARQIALLEAPDQARARMRAANPEWDFMGRTFLVLALVDRALADPSLSDPTLRHVDAIVDETLALERDEGMHHFLLPYSRRAPFVQQPARSVFVDGEIALMLGARLALAPRADYERELDARVDDIAARMEASPVLSLESYPDEVWTFCNTTALAATALADHVRGTDHSELRRRWVEVARERLVDPGTGLLVSSATYDGRPLDGPEGSSLFMNARNLLLVDEAFARDQYARARRALGRDAFGFAWAREWPSAEATPDIDSGPIVPLVEASAGASGMAILGAAAFDDEAFLGGLLASLSLAAFPIDRGGGLRYAASNQVGDAVVLSALSHGPLFARVTAGASS